MRKILLSCAMVLALSGVQAAADPMAETVSRQLRDQGYSRIETSYTWLGRLRVQAVQGDMQREIVINPNTGEILRDYERMVPRIAGNGQPSRQGTLGVGTITRGEGGGNVVDLVDPGTTVGDTGDLDAAGE